MTTIFSMPQNFTSIPKTIQFYILRSRWSFSSDIQIIIIGDSKGSKEASGGIQADYIQDVICSPRGVPLLSDLFQYNR